MRLEDYIAAKLAYKKNKNVTEILKERLGIGYNTPDIIAAAYDLQSGTYSEYAKKKKKFFFERSKEVFTFINSTISNFTSILDVGSGELTMFARLASLFPKNEKIDFFATDISASRLLTGKKSIINEFDVVKKIILAVADSAKLPFATNSIDLIITDHSLEPNGSRLEEVLKELFRISKRYCVFIEPSNAIQSREGMQRMRSLGYIFDLEETIKNLGGVIISEHNTINNYNELNKSKMSIVKVPERKLENKESNNYKKIFTYPGTDYHLEKKGNFLQNKESGFLFPILEEIPILLEQNRILLSNY